MNTLIPLSSPKVDLDTFYSVTEKALGYHITKPSDRSRKEQCDAVKFLSGLQCFHNQENTNKPLSELLGKLASLSAHTSFSFLLICTREILMKSMERTPLKHTVAEGLLGHQLAVVSGTLGEWIVACREVCRKDADSQLKYVYDQAVTYFDSQNLFPAFNAKRKHGRDGIKHLESK